MESVDNKIKYYELLMKYEDTSNYKKYELPEGYHFEFYKPIDQLEWIKIHIESGEFTSMTEGGKIFLQFFGHFLDELDKRCVFIVDDSNNEKVGTATISLLKEKEYGYEAAVDWVAIKKSHQGRGLAKPLISKFMEMANDLGHKRLILHTQTTSWLAVKLYLDYGFKVLNYIEKEGWGIIKAITNHEALANYEPVEDIYDHRNVEIERQLKEMFTGDFNYGVWYKNNLHNVYVYQDGKTYEYEYFEDNGNITLKEVEVKKYKK